MEARRADEGLRARPRVGHGEDARAGVPQGEVLIGELAAVDTLSSGAVAPSEVAALDHEVGDDAVEAGALEGEEFVRGTPLAFRGQSGRPGEARAAPVQRQRKFSAVLGTTSWRRTISILPM